MSCSVHDAIVLETRGIPTVTVCTADFLPGGRMQAASLGMAAYPIVCVPQSYITFSPAEVRELANAHAEEIAAHLLLSD